VPDDLGRKLVAGVGDGPDGSALPTPSHPVHLRVTVPKYQALIRAGMPPKLAITAVMRKLLLLANTLLRDRRTWTPKLA
jgi:hypothetical protein